jgi:predicted dehydrogenase
MIEVVTTYEELLVRSDIAAITIATPVSTHYGLGLRALQAGKHLLLEKPLATKATEVLHLMEEAEKRKLVLAVDHTFAYTGPVRKIKEMLHNDVIGEVLYYDSVRINLGLFQHDVNVIWDLATHDLAIMDYLLDKSPVAVSAVGAAHFNSVEDVAYLTVHFDDDLLAHFHVNWLSPVKIRRILIGGTKHMVVYDDMEPSEKLKVYDKGVEIKGQESIYSTLVQYRIGDMYAPVVPQTEALSLLTAEFVDCIKTGRRPTTDGQAGLNVVRVLEAADASLKSGGRIIKLENGR